MNIISIQEFRRLLQVGGIALLLTSSMSFSQDSDLFPSEDSTYSSEQMDIDGIYRKKRTESENLEQKRRGLEKQNEEMVREKIEDARIKEEQKLTSKLKNILQDSDAPFSTPVPAPVSPVMPAPATAPVTTVTTVNTVTEKVEKSTKEEPTTYAQFKINPFVSAMVVDSNNISFDSSTGVGVMFDSMLSSRFSLGLGLSFGKVAIKDINVGYFGYGLNQQQINYRHYVYDVIGKFFLMPDSMVRPYIGAGAGYTRDRLNYASNQGFNAGWPFLNLNESWKRNYATWTGLVGGEVFFSRNFGINLELRHSRSFSGSTSAQVGGPIPTVNQLSLNRLGQELNDAVFTSVNLGVVGAF